MCAREASPAHKHVLATLTLLLSAAPSYPRLSFLSRTLTRLPRMLLERLRRSRCASSIAMLSAAVPHTCVFVMACCNWCAVRAQGIKLTAEDQQRYDGWDYVDRRALQREVVRFLAWEEDRGPVTVVHNHACCAIM